MKNKITGVAILLIIVFFAYLFGSASKQEVKPAVIDKETITKVQEQYLTKKQFVPICINNNVGTKNECECMYDFIQDEYGEGSLDAFVSIRQETGETPKGMVLAVLACVK